MALFDSPPTSTASAGNWRGGLYSHAMTSTSLHAFMAPTTTSPQPHVILNGGTYASCLASVPGNTGAVRFPSYSDYEPTSFYTVRVTLEYGHWFTLGGNGTENRTLTLNLESVGSGAPTVRATRDIVVNNNSRWSPGAATQITLQWTFSGDDDTATQFQLVFTGGVESEEPVNEALHGIYLRNVLLEVGFRGSLAPTTEFGLHMGSSGVFPGDWHQPALDYRAMANSRVMRRHPLMAASYGHMYAVGLLDQQVRTPSVHGDYLYFEEGVPPYLIYWDRTVDAGAGYEDGGVQLGNAGDLDNLLTSNSVGFWSGVERYAESRNLVAPDFRVEMNGMDMSAFVHTFNNGSVSFVGPPSLAEFWSEAGTRISVYGGQMPIMSGISVRAESLPYTNVRKLTVSLLPTTRYNDVDLAETESLYTISEGMPTDELTYITQILSASGFAGNVYTSADVMFRDLTFWTQVPPDGPGFELEEAITNYYNPELGTTHSVVSKIAEANMLGVYDLPNGDIGLFPLIPYVDYTLTQLLETALPQLGGSAETAVVRVYCDDGQGYFVADPRLDITNISMNLDEGFARVEVEAFSNTIVADFAFTDATFVQGTEGNEAQNIYFQATLPMGAVDSNSVSGGGNAFNNKPWKFRRLEGGSPVDYLSPLTWWQQINQSPGVGEARVRGIKVRGWGIGSRQIAYSQHLEDTFANIFQDDPDGLAAALAFYQAQSTDRAVYGLDGGATGTITSGAEFRWAMKIADVDTSTLKIEPMVGSFMPEFAPQWLPIVGELIERAEMAKPRKAKRVTNSMIAQLGHTYAVQVPIAVTNLESLYGSHYYDEFANAGATHLATWLTCREILKARRVDVRYAGAHYWTVNQFLAIPRRPDGGEGAPIRWYDVLLVMEPAEINGEVNGEVWTSVVCAFIGAYNVVTGIEDHEMPLSWGSVWDRRGDEDDLAVEPMGAS